jgi:hypothetical protein
MALQNQNQALDTVILRSEQFTFVTPQQVKIATGLAANINDDNLIVPIITASNLRMKPILGVTLFNSLKAHYIAANYDPNQLPDGSTLPDNINYKELYFEMYDALCWWSFIESLINIAVKIEEKGIMFNGSDFSTNAELVGYEKVSSRQTKIAEAYTDAFVCYVKDTIKIKELKDEQIESSTTNFTTYFPNTGNCGNCR